MGLGDLLKKFDEIEERKKKAQVCVYLYALGLIGVQHGKDLGPEAKAHHEAGHVLVGTYIGRKLKSAVRIGDDSDVDFWDRTDTNDDRRKERICIAIAGPIAEARFAGSSCGGGSDLPRAISLAGSLACKSDTERNTIVKALAEDVRRILEDAPVEELASAILEAKTLPKAKVATLLKKHGWPPKSGGRHER